MNTQPEHESSAQTHAIPLGLSVFNISFTVIALVLFNVFPHRVGVYMSALDSGSFVALLSQVFFDTYLPWLNAWWGLALALNFAHLGLRRWTLPTHLADLGLKLLGASILVMMIRGGNIVDPDGQWIVAGQPLFQIQEHLFGLLGFALSLILWLALFGTGIGILKDVIDLLSGKWTGPAPDPAPLLHEPSK